MDGGRTDGQSARQTDERAGRQTNEMWVQETNTKVTKETQTVDKKINSESRWLIERCEE